MAFDTVPISPSPKQENEQPQYRANSWDSKSKTPIQVVLNVAQD